MLLSRLVYPLLIPVVILLAMLFLQANAVILPKDYLPLINYVPYVLGIVALILSTQFNQMRFMILSLLVTLGFYLTIGSLQAPLAQPETLALFQQLSLLTPILLVVLMWYPEKGVVTAQSAVFIIITIGLIAGLHYLFSMANQFAGFIELIAPNQIENSVLAPVGLGLFVLAIAHQVYLYWDNQNAIDGTNLLVLVALMINYINFDAMAISSFIYSACMLIIIWGLLKQSHNMAYRDELTGLPGRRALNDALKAPSRKYVIAMLDVDHFKKFNDKYGHDIGDDVLKMVASKISQITGGGLAYRYGGEEFTILFRGKELVQCVPHLEAVREMVANYFMSIREKQNRPHNTKEGEEKRGKATKLKGVSVTISIGVAERNDTNTTAEQVLKAADDALYKAKKAGRNCLVAEK